MSLVHNERTKLLATALNNIGVATVVTGFIAPTIATIYGASAVGKDDWWFLIAAVWILAGIGLHILGQVVLGRLKP